MLRLAFEADDEGFASFSERELSRDFEMSRHHVRAIKQSLIDKCFLTEQTTISTTFRPPFRPSKIIVKVCNTDCLVIGSNETRPPFRPNFDHQNDQDLTLNITKYNEDEETRVEIKGEVFDIKAFVKYWNTTMTDKQAVIPTISRIGKVRRGAILARAREHGKKALATVTCKAAVSDFLNGKNNMGFIANFDWIFKPNNFIKVLDGNYDNNGQVNQGHHTRGDEERQQRESDATDLINQLLSESD